jgi:hypothetical protein
MTRPNPHSCLFAEVIHCSLLAPIATAQTCRGEKKPPHIGGGRRKKGSVKRRTKTKRLLLPGALLMAV